MTEWTLAQLQEQIMRFSDDRDWAQFHTLKDLSAAITIEAAELQEILLWVRAEDEGRVLAQRRQEIEAELADVFIHVINFALAAQINLGQAISAKLEENKHRYPVEKARGRSTKYTEL